MSNQQQISKGLAISLHLILLVVLFIGVLFTGVIFTGCGGKRIDTIGFEKVDNAPDWVVKGSRAFKNDDKRAFYGIGAASGIKNYALLRSTSENRARNEIAKVFEVYMASLMKDYAASTTAGGFDSSTEEQHVEHAIKTVVATTLSGVEIVDHWEYKSKGILFTLARLDLNAFEQNLDKMKDLNSKVRDFVRENAQRLHEELAKEEAKREEEVNREEE